MYKVFGASFDMNRHKLALKKIHPNSFKNNYGCRKEKFVELLTKKYYAKMINFGKLAVFSTRTFLRRAIFVVPLWLRGT